MNVGRIKNPRSIFRRLDEQSAAEDFVNSTNITPVIKTDHAAIELAIRIKMFRVLNVSHLEDETYLNDLKKKLTQWKAMGTNNLSD